MGSLGSRNAVVLHEIACGHGGQIVNDMRASIVGNGLGVMNGEVNGEEPQRSIISEIVFASGS